MDNLGKVQAQEITAQDLSLVESNLLNDHQLGILFRKTPAKHVHTRPGKGGGQFKYVTGGYMKKVLNLMFGWMWNFEILDYTIDHVAKQVIVHGKLTCQTPRGNIIKHQFGRADIKYKRGTEQPLDLGNDLKAAGTDALKKCASELGIASDVYQPNEFKEIQIIKKEDEGEYTFGVLSALYREKGDKLSPEDQLNVERIIDTEEKSSYKKAIKTLQKL